MLSIIDSCIHLEESPFRLDCEARQFGAHAKDHSSTSCMAHTPVRELIPDRFLYVRPEKVSACGIGNAAHLEAVLASESPGAA